jgi:hypothetical protein
MSRASRGAVVFAAIALTVAAASDANADEKATGAASAAFSTLPAGVVPPPPKTRAPSAIAASEKVPGFFMAGRKGRSDYVTLVSSAKLAKQLTDGTRDDGSFTGEACFTEDNAGLRRGGEEGERTWRSDLQPMLTLGQMVQRGQRPPVTAVHSERIAEDAGRATLEVTDAWVDQTTRGARLIARSSVPLELVSTLLGGTKLYAAREGQNVHVVLVTPKMKRSSGQRGLFAIADNTVVSSSCDHIRSTLKTEKGQGQTASFISNVELPSLEPKDADPKPDPMNGFGRTKTEARFRPIHVHSSVTWPSREKEPLLSVSAGWDSREQTGFVF